MGSPPPVPSAHARRPRRGLWSEAPIVLPASLLLFALLGLATLLFYRTSVARLGAEREREALVLAERIAEQLHPPLAEPGRGLERTLRLLPPGAALALLDRERRTLASAGETTGGADTLTARAGTRQGVPFVVGPAASGGSAIVALVPFGGGGDGRLLRLELPANALATEQRVVARLTPLVVALSLGAALLVTLFFRALARPYEALLARARAAGGGERDELDFLLETFDRALGALGVQHVQNTQNPQNTQSVPNTQTGAGEARADVDAGDLEPLAGTLGRTIDGGFLLLDAEARLLVATPRAAELLGGATPRPGTALVEALGEAVGERAAIADALARGEPLPRSTFRLAGEERAVGLAIEPLKGEGGRLRGYLVLVADVSESERAHARERLAEGLAQLGELSAGVAHELRNGLAALGGWIQLLQRRPLEPAAADCAAELEREARQLARVVDDFLAFARPGTRRAERVELAALVRRVAAAPAFADAAISVAIDPDAAEPGAIEGDPVLLERTLANLVANAVAANLEADAQAGEAAPGGTGAPRLESDGVAPGGRGVELALTRRGGRYELRVGDRGPGIPAAIRDRLFEPFVSARPGGVGLGLALARRIVLLHGGTIAAEPREGGGTVVRIEFPASISVS